MTKAHSAKNTRKASLICAFIVFFFDNFGVSIVFPLFAPLVLESQHHILSASDPLATKNLLLGILLAAFPIAQFIAAPIIGDIADQIGRKKVFYFTISGCVIGYFISALALLVESYTFLFFGRFFTGLFAGNLSVCLATIADLSVGEKQRAKNFGLCATLGGTGWVIAMLMGGYLSDPNISSFFNSSVPFWITGCFNLISLLVVAFFFKETYVVKNKKIHIRIYQNIEHVITAFKSKKMRLLFIALFFWMLGWIISIQWYSGFSVERYHATSLQIVWAFVALGVIWAISSSIVNRFLINRFPIYTIVITALALISISQYLSAIETTFLTFTIFYLISSFFGALSWSNMLNIISVTASGVDQGKTMGLSQSMISFAQFLGPFLGGVLANAGIKTIYFSSASIILIAFTILLIWRVNKRS